MTFTKVLISPSAPSSRVQNVRLLGKTASSATFEWDAVECSLRHGLPLGYNFEITSSEYGHTLNANTTETRVRVQELVPFADYAYRVRFMNQAGYGYYSEPVQFQTLQGSEYDKFNFSIRLYRKMKTDIRTYEVFLQIYHQLRRIQVQH